MLYEPIILASSSERRRHLLTQAGIPIAEIFAPETPEIINSKLTPRRNAENIAREKLQAAVRQYPDADKSILAADTIVAKGRRILTKPKDRKHAEQIIKILSGGRHKVITAIAVQCPQRQIFERQVISTVRFKHLTQAEIDCFLGSDEWQGKSGAYALQGQAAAFISFISGSASNIIGLPLFETCQILQNINARK